MADVSVINGYNIKDATAREQIASKVSGALYTVELSNSAWTASNGYATQTQTVSGLKANYAIPPQIDVVTSGTDIDADKATVEAFALVLKADTSANAITFLASDTPSVSFTVNIVIWE